MNKTGIVLYFSQKKKKGKDLTINATRIQPKRQSKLFPDIFLRKKGKSASNRMRDLTAFANQRNKMNTSETTKLMGNFKFLYKQGWVDPDPVAG